MASIQKIQRTKGAVYKVTIRQSGNGTISKTFPLKKQAVEFARTVEGDNKLALSLGNPVTKSLTLSTLIDEYMEQYSGRDQTIIGHLVWWNNKFGHLSMNQIGVPLVRDALKTLAEGKCQHQGKELNRLRSNSTVNRYKAHLSSIFEYGKEHYSLTENPCRDIKSKPENKGRTRFLSDEERTRLLDVCKQSNWDKLYLLVLMALTTGARQSELLNLNHLDVSTKERIAHLHDTKNGEQRLLPLTQEVIALINAPTAPKDDNVVSITSQPKRLGLLFPSALKPHQPFVFRKHWNKALVDANIKNFRFHDLRHSAASWLAKNGATLQEIADVLGHKNISMTMRYSHLCIDHKQDLIDRLMGGLR